MIFKITEGDFKNHQFGDEAYLSNWPMLYILENGKQAYIGQSNHVKTRMAEHLSNEQKQIFDKVHFIYSSKFNQSVTFDYEAKLIQYIVADKRFDQVTNGNGGIADKDYYGKGSYDEDFHQLWRKLQREHLAVKSLEEIENSDLFKYSPYKELNNDQREAVDAIVRLIQTGNTQAIVVNGMPGSGKTIVAIYILKLLKDTEEFKEKSIGFVVPQTSLRKTLKDMCRSIYNLKPSDILSPTDATRKQYDILLVDEAHRLHQYKNISYMGAFKNTCERLGMTTEADELDWILHQSKCTVLFYDRDQVVGPSGIDVHRLQDKIRRMNQERRLVSYYELLTQMRVRGGNSYIDFVKEILSGKAKEKKTFDQYEFQVITGFAAFDQLHYQKDAECELTRMAAGYAWEWASKNDKTKTDIVIQGISKQWNYVTEGWVLSDGAIDQVGCIHSIQGYDLNYAFIIMGDEIGYDPVQEEILIYPENYYDQNGKRTASYDELKDYILHIYYVLLTRGIRGTYLYICNDALREYIMKVVETDVTERFS